MLRLAGITPLSLHVSIRLGATVEANGHCFIIREISDFQTVIAQNQETGILERLAIADLLPNAGAGTAQPTHPNLLELQDTDWQEAQRRLTIIAPLLDGSPCPRSVVAEYARSAGVHVATLYRWTRAYLTSGLLSSLLPQKPTGGRGKSRLDPAIENILTQTIEEYFLNRQQRTIRSTVREVTRRCCEAKMSPPNAETVRLRIKALPMRERLSRRSHRKEAVHQLTARPGSFDEAKQPLDIVQIDHTKIDLIVVDEQKRLPVGRPWITLAIDVYSRMVVGFSLSLDPPGALSTGLCIAHAVLPKEDWLEHRKVIGQWPCWGFPKRIHLDNAKEFHGEMLRRACEQYGIQLDYRPVAQPHMGGHIERLVGTLMHAIHELPGTTFSNPRQRGQYNSDASAVLTLKDLEHWLTEYIIGIYHVRRHRVIGTTPLQRWTSGFFGDQGQQGCGLISRPADTERIRLDFLPFVERTIQPSGVSIDGIQYFGDVLRPYVGVKEDGRKRRFLFRRDPRDISTVYFWVPDIGRYAVLPYRNTIHPPISIWELRELRRKLYENGATHIDEDAIFAAYERLRAHEDNAVKETKGTRRARERRPTQGKLVLNHPLLLEESMPRPDINVLNIKPFEIEELD